MHYIIGGLVIGVVLILLYKWFGAIVETVKWLKEKYFGESGISMPSCHQKHLIDDHNPTSSIITHIEGGSSIVDIEEVFSFMSSLEVQESINCADSGGDFPIHIAVKKQRADVVELLIQLGADISVRNYWDCTPLQVAVSCGNRCAQALLEAQE